MPVLLDRRRFLHSSLAAGFCASVLRGASEHVRVALLSDIHIAGDPEDTFRGFYPHKNLKAVCDQVADTKFDLTLINGDLARTKGEPADYAAVRNFVSPLADKMPLAFTLGNHDDRKIARGQLTGRAGDLQPVEQKLVSTLDIGPVQFVLLDSLMVTNIAAGQLGRKQRDWLSSYLSSATAKPVVVFVHHNPDGEEDTALVDASLLLPILNAHGNVKALIFGHTHVFKTSEANGLHLINLPAVAYNFADGVPIGWVESTFTREGATLQFRAVDGGGATNIKMSQLTWRAN